ncbi:hypothetical protein RSOL_220570 [Rhizoctonia solani AG-3 Rhs1AP]|uniref:Uncharacterized protein n=1 Tax=Rhizoctonia solani AG-3 Rhs1AP TaxID=1086054 RepID=X8J636_9AGAM|nr:hypothetical protein RSOL_220570 [Rhizoctonia solani AG-3 Rhs1AP]
MNLMMDGPHAPAVQHTRYTTHHQPCPPSRQLSLQTKSIFKESGSCNHYHPQRHFFYPHQSLGLNHDALSLPNTAFLSSPGLDGALVSRRTRSSPESVSNFALRPYFCACHAG